MRLTPVAAISADGGSSGSDGGAKKKKKKVKQPTGLGGAVQIIDEDMSGFKNLAAKRTMPGAVRLLGKALPLSATSR